MKKKKREIKKFKMKAGYMLMIIGILFPLLSLTKIVYTDFHDKLSYKKFVMNQQEEEYAEERKIDIYNEKVKENGKNYLVDPFINDEYNAEYDIYKKNLEKIFAYISIPKISVKMPVRLGASSWNLDRGAAHMDDTSLPVGGIGNRSVIAGHRGWYKGNMFLHVNKLKKGDKVYIERNGKSLEYTVMNLEIIMPNDWEKLEPVEGKDMLTLLTCDPVITANPKRLLVNCERISSYGYADSGSESSEQEQPVKSVLHVQMLQKILVAAGWIAEFILIFKLVKLVKETQEN